MFVIRVKRHKEDVVPRHHVSLFHSIYHCVVLLVYVRTSSSFLISVAQTKGVVEMYKSKKKSWREKKRNQKRERINIVIHKFDPLKELLGILFIYLFFFSYNFNEMKNQIFNRGAFFIVSMDPSVILKGERCNG